MTHEPQSPLVDSFSQDQLCPTENWKCGRTVIVVWERTVRTSQSALGYGGFLDSWILSTYVTWSNAHFHSMFNNQMHLISLTKHSSKAELFYQYILSWIFDEVGGLHLCCKQVKATSLNYFLYSHNEVFVRPSSLADMFQISSFFPLSSPWLPFPDISDDGYFTLEVFMFDLIWL